jgi:hypothetical protein
MQIAMHWDLETDVVTVALHSKGKGGAEIKITSRALIYPETGMAQAAIDNLSKFAEDKDIATRNNVRAAVNNFVARVRFLAG